MRYKAAIVLCSLGLVSCLTSRNDPGEARINDAAREPTCEEILESLPASEAQAKIVERSKQAGGYVLSYGAAAAGYTADAAIFVTRGVVTGVVYCPHIAVAAALGGRLYLSSCTVPNPGSTSYGPRAYAGTAELRKPDFGALADAVLQSSRCFADRGSPGDKEAALQQLSSFQKSSVFQELDSTQKSEIATLQRNLESGH